MDLNRAAAEHRNVVSASHAPHPTSATTATFAFADGADATSPRLGRSPSSPREVALAAIGAFDVGELQSSLQDAQEHMKSRSWQDSEQGFEKAAHALLGERTKTTVHEHALECSFAYEDGTAQSPGAGAWYCDHCKGDFNRNKEQWHSTEAGFDYDLCLPCVLSTLDSANFSGADMLTADTILKGWASAHIKRMLAAGNLKPAQLALRRALDPSGPGAALSPEKRAALEHLLRNKVERELLVQVAEKSSAAAALSARGEYWQASNEYSTAAGLTSDDEERAALRLHAFHAACSETQQLLETSQFELAQSVLQQAVELAACDGQRGSALGLAAAHPWMVLGRDDAHHEVESELREETLAALIAQVGGLVERQQFAEAKAAAAAARSLLRPRAEDRLRIRRDAPAAALLLWQNELKLGDEESAEYVPSVKRSEESIFKWGGANSKVWWEVKGKGDGSNALLSSAALVVAGLEGQDAELARLRAMIPAS